MTSGTFTYDGSEQGLAGLVETLAAVSDGKPLEVTFKTADSGMTTKQRGSLHVWLEQFATVLNDAGIDQRLLLDNLKAGAEIPNTLHSMKQLYKIILDAMEGKGSTEDMDKPEPSVIAGILGKTITERVAHAAAIVPPPWPSKDNREAAQ